MSIDEPYMSDWVTVYSDASFNHTTRQARIAYWVRHDGGRIRQAESIGEVSSNSAAEAIAIRRGMERAMAEVPRIVGFHVRSDCRHVLDLMTSQRGIRTPELMDFRAFIDEVSTSYLIRPQYVKAHNGIGDTESYINTWCDLAASGKTGIELEDKSEIAAMIARIREAHEVREFLSPWETDFLQSLLGQIQQEHEPSLRQHLSLCSIINKHERHQRKIDRKKVT